MNTKRCKPIKCELCGATCACKGRQGSMCCSCHRHKARYGTPVQLVMPLDLGPEWEVVLERHGLREDFTVIMP